MLESVAFRDAESLLAERITWNGLLAPASAAPILNPAKHPSSCFSLAEFILSRQTLNRREGWDGIIATADLLDVRVLLNRCNSGRIHQTGSAPSLAALRHMIRQFPRPVWTAPHFLGLVTPQRAAPESRPVSFPRSVWAVPGACWVLRWDSPRTSGQIF